MTSSLAGQRVAVLLAVSGALALAQACGKEARRPAGAPATGGSGGTGGNGSGGKGGTSAGGRGGAGGSAGKSSGGSGNPEGGEAGATGASGGDPGVGGGNTGGTGGAAGGGGAAGNAGSAGGTPEPSFDCPPEPTSGTPPASSPVCDIDAVWGAGERVPVPTSGNDVLLSVTPDELTIAWVAVDVFSSVVYVADRADVADDFGTPVSLMEDTTYSSTQLALSPDGLRLAVAAGGRFLESTRSARGDAFAAYGEGDFATIDADADANGLVLRDPVISTDDRTLYYSATGDGDDTLRVSTRSGSGAWPVGRSLGECEFKSHPQGLRGPRGISSDGLTLFYFDNPRGNMRAAFRPALDWPFLEFVDLDLGFVAQPNEACDRLYYSGMGELPVELLISQAE